MSSVQPPRPPSIPPPDFSEPRTSGLIEIVFGLDGVEVGVHSMTEGLARAVRKDGHDPMSFNRMEWPTGASRHARGRFLLHRSLIEQVMAAQSIDAETITPLSLRMGSVVFDKVFVRNPRPVHISEGSDAVWMVEVVDERWIWTHNDAADPAFNLSLDDKSKLYDDSERNPDEPWNAAQAIGRLIEDLSTDPADWFVPANEDMTDDDDPRDLVTGCRNAADAIDRVCASVGHVVTAFPNGVPRYQVLPLASGEGAALAVLEDFADDVVAGGFRSVPSDIAPPAGAGSVASGDPDWLQLEVPATVVVAFPLAMEQGTGYSVGDEDATMPPVRVALDRVWKVESTNGRPGDGNLQTRCVFDHHWAVMGQDGNIVEEQELQDRADLVARRYYDRFRSGVGRLVIRNFVDIAPWPGSSLITWALDRARGVFTEIAGDYDDPLFGYSSRRPITALDVQTTGRLRAIPRPDGGVLIDDIDAADVYPATITQVQAGFPAATYTAVANRNDSIVVIAQEPLRSDDVDQVDLTPAAIGDPCLIIVRPDAAGVSVRDLYVTERRQYTDCGGAAAEYDQAAALAARATKGL